MFKAEHIGASPSQVSCSNGSYSCHKQIMPEEPPGCDAASKSTEISEQKQQLGSESIQSEPDDSECKHGNITADKYLRPFPEDVINNSVAKDMELPQKDARKSILINESSCTQHSTSEKMLKYSSGGALCDECEEQTKPALELLPDESAKISNSISNTLVTGALDDTPVEAGNISPVKQLSSPPDSETNILKQSESLSKDTAGNSGRLDSRVKRTTKSSRRKHLLKSSISCDRVLRSRSQEKTKAPETRTNTISVCSIEKTRKRKTNKKLRRIEVDEYSRIKARLKYLLNKICYEQSLITAYSSDGWKGLSLEKIKPEKELQRATSEILRRKSEIRGLFQRIDTLCAEGRFSESLFDSEGQISSEDIFCAKCQSKDLTANNDIILCDGACDRGFHQLCLVPPLLNEEIPPDDEGWLCPGCDCKVDCIDILNESQGTNVSITDSWKKVFPEAAEDGQNPDQNQGLSSDDSDDNDFDPDRSEIDAESQGDESSSDDSDSDFTSDEMEAPPGDKQQVGVSSDDSEEDDDYNPDAPDRDDNVKEESSSSDFTSDSDDLPFSDSGEIESSKSKSRGNSVRKNSSSGGGKLSLCNELLSTSEPTDGQDTSSCISAKRSVERLDYKKLYDETYGNASSDTSDDEDYFDIEPTDSTEDASGQARRRTSVMKNANHEENDSESAPKKRRQKSKSENTSEAPAEAYEAGTLPSSSSGKGAKPSVNKRLGEAVTQRLYQSFKENQYPKRPTKESLAKELGITYQQVTKWFDNTRWSYNHPSPMAPRSVRKISGKFIIVPKSSKEPLEPENVTVDRGATFDGAPIEELPKADIPPMEEPPEASVSPAKASNSPKDGQPSSEEIVVPQPKTPQKPRKRKHSLDSQPSDVPETEKPPANSLDGKPREAQVGRHITRRKSIA